ncbi:MAG: MFS transporter [Bacillota bacterium]
MTKARYLYLWAPGSGGDVLGLGQLRTTIRERVGPPRASRLERNIWTNTAHGIFSVAAANMIQPFISIFAIRAGATNFQVAMLSTAPALISLLTMIPGAALVDRRTDKKRLTALFFLAHRFFYFLIALIPFFTVDHRAGVLVVAVALMNLPGSVSNVAWQGFIAAIIPPDRRPSAFAQRNLWMNVAGTVMVLIVGPAIDIIGYPFGYQVVFALAFLLALVEIWVFRRLEEEPSPAGAGRRAPSLSLRNLARDIAAEPRFVRYTLASFGFYLAWQSAWPLFSLYQVRVLGADNTWVSILNLANTGGAIFGYGWWARYAERNGNLKALFVASAGIFIVPAVYAFSNSLYHVAFWNLATGLIFSGVTLTLFNTLLEMTPDDRKTTYIAYYNTAVTVAAVLAPLVGVALLDLLGFMWAFLATALLRIIGSLCFLYIHRVEAADRARAAAAGGSTARG